MSLKNKNYLLFFVLAVFALEAILFFVGNYKSNEAIKKEEEKIERMQKTLSEVSVEAKAVSVIDVDSGSEIYGKNQNEMLPLASLVKTMTVLVSLSDDNSDSEITISKNALDQEGDCGFLINEKWKKKNLAELTLIGSVNDGAYALSENVSNFLEKMNNKARRIGMENSSFSSSTGLDGAYASAKDANIMAIFALKAYPEIFGVTVLPEMNFKSESGLIHNIKNTDIILGEVPNLLFSKTGFTQLAGGNLTIIFKNKEGRNIAITILGSSREGRFTDMQNLTRVL
jgi:D-alanyl-D-alanine carboxypeptidase